MEYGPQTAAEQVTRNHGPGDSVSRFGRMVTRAPALAAVFALLQRVADSNASVLVTGETGTGKELVARGLHEASLRHRSPFVAINCGAMAASLIESELFGHERGAFTGAAGRRAGAFEQADGGTLFLDEIGELPLDLQPRLLRVLDTGEVRRVGGAGAFHVDLRVVAATNRDLVAMVEAGEFRADLFYRLRVIEAGLVPLRDRLCDLDDLVDQLLEELESVAPLSPEASRRLRSHDWPGNVRELKNVLQRAALLAGDDTIDGSAIELPALRGPSSRTLAQVQRDHTLEVVRVCRGNRAEAARRLGIGRSTLFERLAQYQALPGGE